jgi:hypothetical protein
MYRDKLFQRLFSGQDDKLFERDFNLDVTIPQCDADLNATRSRVNIECIKKDWKFNAEGESLKSSSPKLK